MGRVKQSTRRRVYERDDFQCVHCGTMTGLTLQHRVNKGAGGSKLLDGEENLITLCAEANWRLEADAEFAQEGRDFGWKLRRWQDPEQEPCFYAPAGAFFMLDSEGERHRV